MDKLREFFETIILTGRLKGESPVSAMIIADPERGKTSVMVETQCEAFKILTDITGKGLQLLCKMDAKCTHFIVNDMGIVMAHGLKTREYFFAMLLAATEEGIRTIANPDGIENLTSNGRRGFIGCITSTQAGDNRQWWHKRGLARRMIPFHFDFDMELVMQIKAQIIKGNAASFNTPMVLKIPEIPVNVKINEKQAKDIQRLADVRAKALDQLGISMLKNYLAMAKAHTLRNGNWKNPIVTDDAVDFLYRIDPYVDWDNPAIL